MREVPTILSLPTVQSSRGNLSYIEASCHVPFNIRRVYWIYDMRSGQQREGYALVDHPELIVAVSGSFDVIVEHRSLTYSYHLDRSCLGLYVPPRVWRQLAAFSTNAVAMVLSSTEVEAGDRIDEYERFLQLTDENNASDCV